MIREKYLQRLDTTDLDGRKVHCLRHSRPALLVMDMQDYFLNPSSHAFVPSSEELVPALVSLAGIFRSRDLPVIFTRHLNTPENAGMMAVRWRDMIAGDDPLSRISAAFDTEWGTVVTKTQYDAFHRTGLQEILAGMGVGSLVITGVMTNLCCETTARSAFVRGYRICFPVDGTATMNMELHMAAMTGMSYGFCRPSSCRAVERTVVEFL